MCKREKKRERAGVCAREKRERERERVTDASLWRESSWRRNVWSVCVGVSLCVSSVCI